MSALPNASEAHLEVLIKGGIYLNIIKVQLLPTGCGCTFIASLQTTL